ncbi:hypothetical protein [Rothia terrae]|uniref:Uncharacterized protein n=1 Tax=Rothia terrae TaxID=396015 RepID=A0A7H2BDN1_9MICC|nr:hypothetical protein [Rothia terrae]QNV37777.1 hypothetical protein IDM49_00195 [Rothia terrae]
MASEKPEPSSVEIVGKTVGFSVLIAGIGAALVLIIAIIGWGSYSASMEKNSKASETRQAEQETSLAEALAQNHYLADGEGIPSSSEGGLIIANLDSKAYSDPGGFARVMMKTFESEQVEIVRFTYGRDKTLEISRTAFDVESKSTAKVPATSSMTEQTWKDILELTQEEKVTGINVTEKGEARVFVGELVQTDSVASNRYNQQVFAQKMKDLGDLKTPEGLEKTILEDAFTYTRGEKSPIPVYVSVQASQKNEVMPAVEAIMDADWSPEPLNVSVSGISQESEGMINNSEQEAALSATVNLNTYASRYNAYGREAKRQKAVEDAQTMADSVIGKVDTPLKLTVTLLEASTDYNDTGKDAAEARNF